MVSRTAVTISIACSLVALSQARADLQLKPQTGEYEVDGFKFSRVVFPDGERKVTYTPPNDWEYTGDAAAFVLHPKSKTEAEAVVSHGQLNKGQVFDEEGTK